MARLGGDEFVLVFRLDADYYAVDVLADELHKAFEVPINLGEVSVRAGGAVGFAESPGCTAELDELLGAADAAMYSAKRKGCCLAIYREEDDGPPVRAPRAPIRTRDHRVPPPGAEVRSR